MHHVWHLPWQQRVLHAWSQRVFVALYLDFSHVVGVLVHIRHHVDRGACPACPVRTNGEGLKAVQYSGVIPYVVEAQKQHDDAIRQLEEKVTALQQKNAEQSQLIAVQSQQIAALLSHLPTAQTH